MYFLLFFILEEADMWIIPELIFSRENIFSNAFANTIYNNTGVATFGKFYPPSLVKIIPKGQEGFKS